MHRQSGDVFAGEDTCPALGLSTLVIRLKTVDLPAPLGR
jgi:hypothetical protein